MQLHVRLHAVSHHQPAQTSTHAGKQGSVQTIARVLSLHREHHHLFTYVPQHHDGRPGLWLHRSAIATLKMQTFTAINIPNLFSPTICCCNCNILAAFQGAPRLHLCAGKSGCRREWCSLELPSPPACRELRGTSRIGQHGPSRGA